MRGFPPPFLENGRVGLNPAFSLSAVREFLALQQEGKLQSAGGTRFSEPCSAPVAPAAHRQAHTQKDVEGFFDAMRPANAQGTATPLWVDKLLDGGMAAGCEF